MRFYPGDAATAQAIIADVQHAGIQFSAFSNDAASTAAFGENQQHAVLVQQVDDAVVAIDVAFTSLSQPSDHAQARQHLDALQVMILVRYLGVKSGQITMPTVQAGR